MKAPTDKQVRESVLVITIGFAVLYFLFHRPWMAVVAGLVAVCGLFIPPAARWTARAWWGLAHVLGWINGRILLSVVFFLVLTPIALLRRLGRRDAMRTVDRTAASHWTARDHTYTAADLEKPW
jgi:saxitoxin biosynthesis operon SxtJ-like protein